MTKHIFLCFFVALALLGCNFNAVVDTNDSVRDGNWLYANPAKANFQIENATTAYDVNFKLRINSDYRYSNLYVIVTTKGERAKKRLRHGFKIADADGAWLGKGSGNLYTYSFPVLRNHRFADTGKYSIEIEQNMRDNPLKGVSDVGIEILKR
jgi:gliding motility-associated lipoprotein GldH